MSDVVSNIIETRLDVPITLKHDKHYPVGYYNNNRHRGPIESFKSLNTDAFIIENITKLCEVYNDLSHRYKTHIEPLTAKTVEDELMTFKGIDNVPPVDLSSTIINPTFGVFDLYEDKDTTIAVSINFLEGEVLNIKCDTYTLTPGIDYLIISTPYAGNIIEIYSTYLNSFAVGLYNLSINFMSGVLKDFELTVVNTMPIGTITPDVDDFEDYEKSIEHTHTVITIDGDTIEKLSLLGIDLVEGVDWVYGILGDVVPEEETFNKKLTDTNNKDLVITVLNDSVSSITCNGYTLIQGVDYIV